MDPVPEPQSKARAGLYIHVPFCRSVCPYCDFAVTIAGEPRRDDWVESVVLEARGSAHLGLQFDTVYLGGGTPSSLHRDQLAAIFEGVRDELEISDNVEYFLEANPEDVTRESADTWRRLGVSSLSLGVQSFDDEALAFLGRNHDGAEARRAAEIFLNAGFRTVSVDLIFGLPGQTIDHWRRDLETAVAIGADHISCYQLTFHRSTIFGNRLRRGQVEELDEGIQAELFHHTHRVLTDAGYEAYEVSNFAVGSDHRSRHNQKYWDHTPYLGLGPSAHSFVGSRRWWNLRKVRLWSAAVRRGTEPVEASEDLTPSDLLMERLALGLRTTDGVDLEALRRQYAVDLFAANRRLLDDLAGEGLVRVDGARVRPTVAGLAVADGLVRSFEVPDQAPRRATIPRSEGEGSDGK
ncbi:MAG: radical SAM family heme chaperone HemW [Holophagae bacterium]